jgi:hypothetical protein
MSLATFIPLMTVIVLAIRKAAGVNRKGAGR